MDDNQESETDEVTELEDAFKTTSQKNSAILEVEGTTSSSLVVILTPRIIYSEVGLPVGTVTLKQIDTYIQAIDEESKSTVSLRVSCGKSTVNLTDPSRIYRRVPAIIPQQTGSPVILRLRTQIERVVKFKSDIVVSGEFHHNLEEQNKCSQAGSTILHITDHPQDKIFPSLRLPPNSQQESFNLTSDFDFYKPGQTIQHVLQKLARVKSKMIKLKMSLQKTRDAFNLSLDESQKTSDKQPP